MAIRNLVLLGCCLALIGCDNGGRGASEAEIKANKEKMTKQMESMPKLPSKLENPNDPMKNMQMPAAPGIKR